MGKNHLTLYVVFAACLGSYTWGYNSGIIGSTMALSGWTSKMGVNAGNSARLEGTVNALFSVGGWMGGFISTYANDKYGRLTVMLVGCICCIIATALTAGAQDIAMFTVGRWLMGIGVGHLLVIVPQYQSEIVPHSERGLLVGLHGVILCVGFAVAQWLGFAFSHVTNQTVAWRIPLALGAIGPIGLACATFFLPQSPRWLIQKNRHEEAMAITKRLHFDPDHPENELYKIEHAQMVEQYDIDVEAPSSWVSFVRLPHYRVRALLGFFTMFFVTCSGSAVITYYQPSLYASLGYGTEKQLLLSAAWQTITPFGNIVNAYFLDKIGRRLILSLGLIACSLALMAEAISVAVFQHNTDKTVTNSAVAFLYVFITVYACSQDASSYVYTAEIFPNHLRSKGVAISSAGFFTGNILWTGVAPYGFDSLGYKYYIIQLIFACVGGVVEFIWWPETSRKTLEEMGAQFGDPVTRNLEEIAVTQGEKARQHEEEMAAVTA